MLRRILFSCGIAAPLVYVAAVVLGGILDPAYNQLSMAVSELLQRSAANLLLLQVLFVVYNVLLIVFAWAEGMSIRGDGLKVMSAGCVILAVVGFLGILLTVFLPMDARGAPQTTTGLLHLIIAGVLSLGSILTVAFLGIGSKVRDRFWVYSFVSAVLLVLSGAGAAVLAGLEHPLLGLAERATIGLFLLWIFCFGVRLVREDMGRAG
jgi:hypothetical protein